MGVREKVRVSSALEVFLLTILILLLLASIVCAGRIADVFSAGIFGLRWESTEKRVSEIFPNGNKKPRLVFPFMKAEMVECSLA